MIAMKMGNQDHVDFVSRNTELREARIGRPPTVEEHPAPLAPDEYSGLTPPTGTEGIARSNEDQFTQGSCPTPAAPGPQS
jgi:hypothetical protein